MTNDFEVTLAGAEGEGKKSLGERILFHCPSPAGAAECQKLSTVASREAGIRPREGRGRFRYSEAIIMRWHVGNLWAASAPESPAAREQRFGYWLVVWVLAMLAARA